MDHYTVVATITIPRGLYASEELAAEAVKELIEEEGDMDWSSEVSYVAADGSRKAAK